MEYKLKTRDGTETFYAMSKESAREEAKAAALEYGWAYLLSEHGVVIAGYQGSTAS